LKQIRPVKGYKAEQNDGWQSNRTIMKNTFEPDVSNKSNSTRQLAWLAGLVSLGLSVWAAMAGLAFHHTHQTHRARSCCNWYHRGHLEFRQFVSVVNYILTPEDDAGVAPFWNGSGQPLPVFGRLIPTTLACPVDTPEASVATNNSAPPKS
jgi:hypothetical protein